MGVSRAYQNITGMFEAKGDKVTEKEQNHIHKTSVFIMVTI
jgi:hypothetical protein